jgi:hypothetical protein
MSIFTQSNGGIVSTVLGSAVANGGTVAVSYPSGYTQDDFLHGLSDYGNSHVMVNSNDKVVEGSGGIALSFGASTITVTNNTGASWAAGTKLDFWFQQRRNNKCIILAFPMPNMASIADGDLVTEIFPGVEGYIEHVWWVQEKAVTTAAKASTLNLEIGTTNLTGGVVSLTSAACTPIGVVIEGTQITANNRLVKSSKLSVEASSVTAFSEGSGTLYVRIRLDEVG